MKLVELASELSLSRSDIVAFLATHDLKTGSQEHLAPEQVARVRRHFARLQAGKHKATNPTERPDVVAHKTKASPSVEPQREEQKEDDESALSTDAKAKRVERAKVALPGLKVLGKIDLSVPSPKPKSDSDEKNALTPPKKDPKGKEPYRKKAPRKAAPTVLERAKEEQTPKQKQRRSKKQRERRAQRYRKKVATYRVPIKSLREEQAAEYEVYEEGKDIAPPEKNWLRRLFNWFISS